MANVTGTTGNDEFTALDRLDKRVLYELDLNARLSASALAKKLRKSKETINFRINRLVKSGYLKGFYAVLNTSKLGFFYYKLYLKFRTITPAKEKEIIEYIQSQNRIAYLASMEGYYDVVFLILARNFSEITGIYDRFMKQYGDWIQEKDSTVFLTTHRLNQKFFYSGEGEGKDLYYPVEITGYRLDDAEERILDILAASCRTPITEIAKQTGLEPKAVGYRIKKLEKDGIIRGYVTSPNFEKLGLQFIQINISLKDPTVKKAIIAYFDGTNKCLYAIESIGKYDLVIEVHVKNSAELKVIVDGFRNGFFQFYNDYDVATIDREYVINWRPFGKKQ